MNLNRLFEQVLIEARAEYRIGDIVETDERDTVTIIDINKERFCGETEYFYEVEYENGETDTLPEELIFNLIERPKKLRKC